MAVNNTYTEQFDWFNLSPHKVETNGTENSIKVINDYCKSDFSYDAEAGNGGATESSGSGQDNIAYKNWKNINLGLGPLCGYENPVIVGQCRQTIANVKDPDGGPTGGNFVGDPTPHPGNTSWFQGINSGDFQSDGMIMMPHTCYSADKANYKWHLSQNQGHNWFYSPRGGVWENSQQNVIQYYVPGGLAPNTWMPLVAWQPYLSPDSMTAGLGHHWLKDAYQEGTNYWEYYADQAVNAGGRPNRSPHQRIHGLRSAPHEDTVWNQYDVDSSQKWQNDSGSVSYNHRAMSSNAYGRYKSSNYPVVWWYAHDGQGNAMIISLIQYWNNNHNLQGNGYNGHWGVGGENGNHGQNEKGSGMYLHKPPSALVTASEGGIAQLQQWANAQNTSWVYTGAADPLRSSWIQSTGANGDNAAHYRGQAYAITAGHIPEIIHGLTPFGNSGTGGAVDFSSPTNLYIHRYGAHEQILGGRPMTSWKIGNLVKTNFRNAWYNGHGRGKNYTVQNRSGGSYNPERAPHMRADMSMMAIAASDVKIGTANDGSTGPVRINSFTCGGQLNEDGTGAPVREDAATMFFEFPGHGVSYGAIDKDVAGDIEHAQGAWENASALVDPSNANETICKASGEDNAVFVPLVGMTEGNLPDGGDRVKTITLTLGGTRKMVLGPQVLKVTVVANNKASLGLPVKTVPGEGSDTLNDDLTLVWPETSLNLIDYKSIKDALVKIWVETP